MGLSGQRTISDFFVRKENISYIFFLNILSLIKTYKYTVLKPEGGEIPTRTIARA